MKISYNPQNIYIDGTMNTHYWDACRQTKRGKLSLSFLQTTVTNLTLANRPLSIKHPAIFLKALQFILVFCKLFIFHFHSITTFNAVVI